MDPEDDGACSRQENTHPPCGQIVALGRHAGTGLNTDPQLTSLFSPIRGACREFRFPFPKNFIMISTMRFHTPCRFMLFLHPIRFWHTQASRDGRMAALFM